MPGAGWSFDGNLQDEDLEPVTVPYSSTDSEQDDGELAYATIDVGAYFWDGPKAKLGGFLGYNYLNQELNAFGCEQTATNPVICVPTLPTSELVITQESNWHSFRVGMNGQVSLTDRLMISAEGAWLPFVSLDAVDTHHFTFGAIPDEGEGWGFQFEAIASLLVTDRVSLGLGGRYWHMETETASGTTHFERIGLPNQKNDWSIDLFGALAEAKIAF